MFKILLARTWLVVIILATLGLGLGVVMADAFTGRDEHYMAQATLAMLPQRDLPLEQVPSFWEVLNRGQATGSAAIILKDDRWVAPAAAAAGVPKSDLALSAGAIPDSTLITVTMTARSARAAEAALNAVLGDAVGPAAHVSGPFRLETVVPADGSAVAMTPTPTQMFGALGIAGALVGGGAGLFVRRFLREASARQSAEAEVSEDAPVSRHAATGDGAGPTTRDTSTVGTAMR